MEGVYLVTDQVIQAGADSIAVVSAICSARDPFEATQALCAHFKQRNSSQENPS